MNSTLKNAIKNKDVNALCQGFFRYGGEPLSLTPAQEDIVRTIAYDEEQRILVNAMTRYGKTLCAAAGVLLYILLHPNKKNAIIAPQQDQANKVREYMSELIIESPLLADTIDFQFTGMDRLKKEASKYRQTFKNGSEYRIFSAAGEANRLMGFGVSGILLVDEACLIPHEAEAKIIRMLGDAPKETKLVKLANPWSVDNQYYRDWQTEKFKKIHIPYQVALKEGRTTEDYINEVRESVTPIEFQVLYNSDFPDQPEDALFDNVWITRACSEKREDIGQFFERKEQMWSIAGLDVAEYGRDLSVLVVGKTDGRFFIIEKIISWAKKDTMETVAKAVQNINRDMIINIDSTGLGAGVHARLKELGYNARRAMFGAAPKINKERLLNLKSQYYHTAAKVFENGLISMPKNDILNTQLRSMKYDYTSGGKMRIIDPEDKSPDFADALVIFISCPVIKDKKIKGFYF